MRLTTSAVTLPQYGVSETLRAITQTKDFIVFHANAFQLFIKKHNTNGAVYRCISNLLHEFSLR